MWGLGVCGSAAARLGCGFVQACVWVCPSSARRGKQRRNCRAPQTLTLNVETAASDSVELIVGLVIVVERTFIEIHENSMFLQKLTLFGELRRC